MARSHTLLTRRYALPLRQPLTTARGQWSAHTGTLVGWCQDGHTAWACAPDLPQWPQHAEAVRAFAEELAQLAWLAHRADTPLPRYIYDHYHLKRRGFPYCWVNIDLAATLDEVGATDSALAPWMLQTGVTTIKVKVTQDCDPKAVKLWLRPLARVIQRLRVRLDANQAWVDRSESELRVFMQELVTAGVHCVEDPLPARWWPSNRPMKLAIDTLDTPTPEVLELARQGRVNLVVLKPALCGSVAEFLKLVRQLVKLRVPVVVSSCFEPPCGLAQLAALASLVPGARTHHGLLTHLHLQAPHCDALPPPQAGRWNMDKLAKRHQEYESVDWRDLVRQAAADQPHAPALCDAATGRTWRWQALAVAVDTEVQQLECQGVGPGKPVVLQKANSPELVIRLWALWQLGAIAVVLHPQWTKTETVALTRRIKALRFGKRVGQDRVLAIVATSGTTGTPKLVVLTVRSLSAAAFAYWQRTPPVADECWVACLPLCHVAGLALLWRAAAGRVGLVLSAGDTASIAQTLTSQPCTTASLVPTQLARLLEAGVAPGSLRTVIVGGATLDPDLHQRALDAGWPVVATWGMTETCAMAALGAVGQLPQQRDGLRLVGPAMPGIELAIAGDSAEGEIVVRGDQVAGKPGQWFKTGDHGHLDGQGNLWVASRRADRIIRGGENIDPLEVEAALLRVPGVIEVAVVGLDHAELGQEVAAWVVGRAPLPTLAQLQAALAGLARYKWPTRWMVTDRELPRGAMGKVGRVALSDALLRWVAAMGCCDGFR